MSADKAAVRNEAMRILTAVIATDPERISHGVLFHSEIDAQDKTTVNNHGLFYGHPHDIATAINAAMEELIEQEPAAVLYFAARGLGLMSKALKFIKEDKDAAGQEKAKAEVIDIITRMKQEQ